MKHNLVVVVFVLLSVCLGTLATETKKETSSADLIAFEKWFQEHLLDKFKETLKVQVKQDENGNRGLYATADINRDDIILEMPWHLMITVEKIWSDFPELVDILSPIKTNLGDDYVLALVLVYLKQCNHQNTFWDPWLNVLPKKFNTILYFTDDEIKLMRGLPRDTALWRRQDAAEKYATFSQEIFPNFPSECREIDYDAFKWGLSVVSSRRIKLATETKDIFSAIAPYFDFFNHENPNRPGQHMWGYSNQRLELHTESMASYKLGHQVFVSYGSKCNDELIDSYGFFLEDNTDACVHLTLESLENSIAANDPYRERKLELLEMKIKSDYSLQMLGDAMTEEMLFASQIISFEPELSDHELAMHRVDWIINLCNKLMENYPSEEEDEKIINSPAFSKISVRARNAILLRQEERGIIAATLESHQTLLEEMRANPPSGEVEEAPFEVIVADENRDEL